MKKTYLIIASMFILTAILYAPIGPDFYALLLDSNNSHGLFVPFISVYLIYQQRDTIQGVSIEHSTMGLVLLLISIFLYFLGIVGGIEVLPRVSLVLTIIGILYYNLGRNLISKIYFPLLFLFFMIPVPVSLVSFISLPLKMIATKLSASILTAVGIPVLREGNMLYFVNASLEVAEACSGIRSLISYLMLGILFAYTMDLSFAKKVILVALTVPMAFFANLLRVTGTGFLAHFYGNKVAQGFLHEFSGMVTFALGLIMIVIISQLLSRTYFLKKVENDE